MTKPKNTQPRTSKASEALSAEEWLAAHAEELPPEELPRLRARGLRDDDAKVEVTAAKARVSRSFPPLDDLAVTMRTHLKRAKVERADLHETEPEDDGKRTHKVFCHRTATRFASPPQALGIVQQKWRPRRDSNPCYSLERAVSWAGLDDGDVLSEARSILTTGRLGKRIIGIFARR